MLLKSLNRQYCVRNFRLNTIDHETTSKNLDWAQRYNETNITNEPEQHFSENQPLPFLFCSTFNWNETNITKEPEQCFSENRVKEPFVSDTAKASKSLLQNALCSALRIGCAQPIQQGA